MAKDDLSAAPQFVLMGIVVLATVSGSLALKFCSQRTPVHEKLAADADDSIVGLPGTSVLIAPDGTVGRDLLDWLATGDTEPRLFELGGQEFEGRAVDPTIESKVRIKRLVTMLNAYPDIRLHAIGYTNASGDDRADLQISQARAQWLIKALADAGIAPTRLSAEGRGGKDPVGDNATEQGRARNQRVAIVLSRGHGISTATGRVWRERG
jgi:hypothetical protein